MNMTKLLGDILVEGVQPAQKHVLRRTTEAMESGVTFETGGDALGKEYHGYIVAYDKSGKKIGYVDYSVYQGETSVKMVQVNPEYRRQGYGLLLLNKLQDQSDTPITIQGNFATTEGEGLWNKFKNQVAPITEARVFKAPSEKEIKARHKELMDKYKLTPDMMQKLRQAFAWQEAQNMREDPDIDFFYDMFYDSQAGWKDQPDYQVLLELISQAEDSGETPEEYAKGLFVEFSIE